MTYIAFILITLTSIVTLAKSPIQGLFGPLTSFWLGLLTSLSVITFIFGIACIAGHFIAPITRNKWDDNLVMDCSKWYLRLAEWLPAFGKTKRVKWLESMVKAQMRRTNQLEDELKKRKKR